MCMPRAGISTELSLCPRLSLGVIQSHLDLVKGQAAAGFWGQEGVPWPGWGPAGGPQRLFHFGSRGTGRCVSFQGHRRGPGIRSPSRPRLARKGDGG